MSGLQFDSAFLKASRDRFEKVRTEEEAYYCECMGRLHNNFNFVDFGKPFSDPKKTPKKLLWKTLNAPDLWDRVQLLMPATASRYDELCVKLATYSNLSMLATLNGARKTQRHCWENRAEIASQLFELTPHPARLSWAMQFSLAVSFLHMGGAMPYRKGYASNTTLTQDELKSAPVLPLVKSEKYRDLRDFLAAIAPYMDDMKTLLTAVFVPNDAGAPTIRGREISRVVRRFSGSLVNSYLWLLPIREDLSRLECGLLDEDAVYTLVGYLGFFGCPFRTLEEELCELQGKETPPPKSHDEPLNAPLVVEAAHSYCAALSRFVEASVSGDAQLGLEVLDSAVHSAGVISRLYTTGQQP